MRGPNYYGPTYTNNTMVADAITPSNYSDVIMGAMASQITSRMIVYSTFYSGADQRKHLISASLAFVRGFHRWPVNSKHKWPVTQKMFPFDDVIMRPCDINYIYKRMDFDNLCPVSVEEWYKLKIHFLYSLWKIQLAKLSTDIWKDKTQLSSHFYE